VQRQTDKFVPGRQPELRENLPQVIVDCARAEKQLSSDGLVGRSFDHESSDLQPLRGQLRDRADVAFARSLTRGEQFRPRLFGHGVAQPFERVDCDAKRRARVGPAATTP
jgi:hypothetical protein